MGRPTDYTLELGSRVLDLIASGKSVRQIGRMAGLPAARTIHAWAARDRDFAQRYVRACEERGEMHVDQALEVAEKLARKQDPTKGEVAAARLHVDTLFRRAGQLAPKKLGPLMRLAGEDGGALPLVIRRERKPEGEGA